MRPVSTVNIEAGASNIHIRAPKTVGIKLIASTGLSSQNIIGLKSVGSDTYESENYATAEKKIDISCKLGVSSLRLERE